MPDFYCFRGRHLLLGVGLGLLVSTTFGTAAQTLPADAPRLHYSEEVATPPTTAPPLRVQREERSLWKLGLNNFLPGARTFGPNAYYTRYGLHLAYERRLGRPGWSVLGEVSPAVTHFRLGPGGPLQQGLSVRAQVAGRYYYNQERRLRQGRRSGNFLANYVSVALGAGLGRSAHETPFYQFALPRGGVAAADAAVLYGLQRRLGRYGFVDANLGVTTLLSSSSGISSVDLSGSLRVGLTLGAPPELYAPRLVPAGEVVTLRPRFYVGAEAGLYDYRLRYPEQNPYPESVVKTSPGETQTTNYPAFSGRGFGTYSQTIACAQLPYLYVGYYVAPRLAVQLGVQREANTNRKYGTFFDTPQGTFVVPNWVDSRRDLAVPVLLRYSLVASFLRRLQLDALGGLVPVWSSEDFREYQIVNRQTTGQETFGFQRSTFGLHAAAGLAASYGFGRRQRVQVTAEGVVNKDLRTVFRDGREDLQGGASVGLRYRFGYR
ncbi:hypothetical protein ACFQ48_06870 [Hymenobacter caeli]|uniref:Outer membrane protein beta-barrel domain-containing protein n=1 Tax=Hymenobacter caeli TaxID=2735894 RepID=A0ABX2FR57_9BACT|nr:hypothetical protein [Hymenobacter caeli]NRT18905.1 hypothetical protein [Hymenobacter caeli]